MVRLLSAPPSMEYPSSDGKPIAEGDFQLYPLLYAVDRLALYFRNDPDVYVSGNLLLYYEERNLRARGAGRVRGVWSAQGPT